MSPRGKSANMVKINGVKLRGLIEDRGFTMSQLSTGLLGMSDAVIGNSIRNNLIAKEHLDKICFIFNEKTEDYIVKDEPKPETIIHNNPVLPVMPVGEYNKTLQEMLALMTEQNKKMDLIISSLTTLIEGQKKMQEHLDIDLDSIDDSLSKVTSGINIANGRLRDICSHEQKTATKLKNVKSV